MTSSPCGRARCPVPEPTSDLLRRVRTVTWPAGLRVRRGHPQAHPDPTELVPGRGDTRFAPVAGTAHVYVAATTLAALLETALHDAAPPAPRVPEVVLSRWAEAAVQLRSEVRLVDLRDEALADLKLDRARLTATSAAHYACTRRWADRLHGRAVGGRLTHGLVWNSRQLELQARAVAGRPALAELLGEHPAEVAVLWAPPVPAAPLVTDGTGLGPLDRGPGRAYIDDVVALLGFVSQ